MLEYRFTCVIPYGNTNMGCSPSCPNSVELKTNGTAQIEKMIQQEKANNHQIVKLLLLGAADSGKSTLAKQLRIIHRNGFSDSERSSYVLIIHCNAMGAIADILQAMTQLDIPLDSPDRQLDKETVLSMKAMIDRGSIDICPELAQTVTRLWKDAGVQSCFTRSSEFQLNDSAFYYLSCIERLAEPKYLPTDQDILRSRVRTTGVIETYFEWKNYKFRLFDVGGQRSERRKWIHVFDLVTSIIFTASLSCYDLTLREDRNTNRMRESMQLFSSICHNTCFEHTSIILFLNKKDLFEQKIMTTPLQNYFHEYTGGPSYVMASDFIRRTFIDIAPRDKEVYSHFTNATDTQNINFVFDAAMATLFKRNLEEVGMF